MSRKWKHRKPQIKASRALTGVRRDEPRSFQFTCASAVAIKAAEGADGLGTFDGVAYTGAPMRPMGWWNQVVIDLEGVRVPSQHRPALRQHDHEQIVGHTTSVKVVKGAKGGINVAGVFSGEQQHTEKVVIPARNGFQWQLSVGADPVRSEFLEPGEEATVNGRKITGPMTISRETEIGEISFVPLGADGDTSVSVAAQKGETMNPFVLALKELVASYKAAGKPVYLAEEAIEKMTADEARLALKKCMDDEEAEEADDYDDDEDDDDGKKAKSKSKSKKKPKSESAAEQFRLEAERTLTDLRRNAAAEHQRHSDITAAVQRHGVTEVEVDGKKVNLVAHAIEQNWPPERAELFALRAARPSTSVGVPGGLGYSPMAPQVGEAVLEAGLLHAARHQFLLDSDDFYHQPTPDGRGKMRRVPERLQAETQRELTARYTDETRQHAHDLFANTRHPSYIGQMTPRTMLSVALRASGHQQRIDLSGEHGIRSALAAWADQDQRSIRAEGASNLSISNILANVLNKFAMQGYLFTEQAWREIAGVRGVPDFKPTKYINLLGDVMFKQLGSSAELKNADVADQAFSNQAIPYGRILTIPWTHLVNDDLGMLTGVPLKLGQGAGLALNDAFWSLWAAASRATTVNGVSAPNGDDGNAFWRTTSSTTRHKQYNANKSTGAGSALGTSALATGKALFDNQVDPDGNPLGFDGTMPILLHGPTNWQSANQLLYGAVLIATGLSSTSAKGTDPAKNVWAGAMRPVMTRYSENSNYGNSTTAWWILFNPAALPVIEVAFLNGVDTPAILQASPDYQFDRLGVSIRGTMPFGVNTQNFRGGVYMAGA